MVILKCSSSKSFFRDRLVRIFFSLILGNLRKRLCYIYDCGKETKVLQNSLALLLIDVLILYIINEYQRAKITFSIFNDNLIEATPMTGAVPLG